MVLHGTYGARRSPSGNLYYLARGPGRTIMSVGDQDCIRKCETSSDSALATGQAVVDLHTFPKIKALIFSDWDFFYIEHLSQDMASLWSLQPLSNGSTSCCQNIWQCYVILAGHYASTQVYPQPTRKLSVWYADRTESAG